MKVRDISLPNIIKVRMDFYKGYEKELKENNEPAARLRSRTLSMK